MTAHRFCLRIVINARNENHHLWLNHGIWFVSYTVHPKPWTKERVRQSLKTRCVEVARQRRDELFAAYPLMPEWEWRDEAERAGYNAALNVPLSGAAQFRA